MLFDSILPDFIELQPDTLDISISLHDTTKEITSFTGLNSIKSLKKITISGNYGIENLNFLKGLNQLSSLEISFCTKLQDIEVLNELPSLKKLEISFCDEIMSLNGISKANNLIDLTIFCDSLKDVRALKNLKNVKRLSCNKISSESVLSHMIFLESLYLVGCKDLKVIDEFKNLIELKSLDLTYANIENIEGLRRLEGLEKLELNFCDSLVDISPLMGLVNMKELQLKNFDRPINVNLFKSMRKLEILDLLGCDSLLNTEALQYLINLKELHFEMPFSNKTTNLNFLNKLKKLESLYLINSDFISGINLDFLRGLG